MKSCVGVILLFTIFATTALAATARGVYNDPKNPGKCTIKDNLILSPGDDIKHPDMDCARIICFDGGFAVFHTCGLAVVDGCTMGGYIDTSLPYPECCQRHITCL